MLAPTFFRSFFNRKSLLCIALVQMSCFSDAYAQVRVTNLFNQTVATWITGDPTIIRTNLVCIYNTAGRTYGITATGGPSGFLLSNGANTLAYTVLWNDGGAANPAGGTTAPMFNGIKLAARNNARIPTDTPTNSTDCNAGASPTAQLTITINSTAMDAARDGTFTGTLTLLLSAT
jgi:hypothetical protein